MKYLILLVSIINLFGASNKFFDNSRQGWFYYEEKEKIKIEKEDKDKKFVATIPKDLSSMSAEEFSKTFEKLRKISVMKPTKTNMLAYKRMMAFAREQSDLFAKNYHLASFYDDSYDYHDGGGPFSANAIRDKKDADDIAKFLTQDIVFVTFLKDGNGKLAKKQIIANLDLRREYGVDSRTFTLKDYPEMEKKLKITKDVENFVFYKKTKKWQRIKRNLITAENFVKEFIFYEKNKHIFTDKNTINK